MILTNILDANADELSVLISDTIKYSKFFKWTTKPLQGFQLTSDHPVYLFIHSYILCDLVEIFKAHINKQDTIKQLLLPFIYNLHLDIYQCIWKIDITNFIKIEFFFY
jgi:hypothetical protein